MRALTIPSKSGLAPVLLLALALGACATDRTSGPTTSATAAPPVAGSGPGVPAGKVDPSVPTPRGGAGVPNGATAFRALTPVDLVDLSDQQVAVLFGRPPYVRKEEPAQVWQYRAGGCVLDVFLYRDSSGYRVRHAELRQRGKAAQPTACGDVLRPRPAAV